MSPTSRLSTSVPSETPPFYRDPRLLGIPDAPFPKLRPAVFVARPNRFLVLARVGNRDVRIASRDPGRLRELLTPGAALLVAPAPPGSRRRTAYTLFLVRKGRRWVSCIPALANEIFRAAIARGAIPALRGARVVGSEVRRGSSRFDFLLSLGNRLVLTEVKSATLVRGGRALFPDAPTLRGARHVRELADRARRGGRSLVVFVVQRADARRLAPNAPADPHFARALREAARAGVRVLACACRVTPRGCTVKRAIPVELRVRLTQEA